MFTTLGAIRRVWLRSAVATRLAPVVDLAPLLGATFPLGDPPPAVFRRASVRAAALPRLLPALTFLTGLGAMADGFEPFAVIDLTFLGLPLGLFCAPAALALGAVVDAMFLGCFAERRSGGPARLEPARSDVPSERPARLGGVRPLFWLPAPRRRGDLCGRCPSERRGVR